MRFLVHINGIPVECETVQEVFALTGKPEQALPSAAGTNGRPVPASRGNRTRDRRARAFDVAVEFLDALLGAGPRGLTSDELAEALELDSTAAIGGVVTPLNRLLAECNIDVDEVYGRSLDPKGDRRWLAGRLIKEGRAGILKMKGE